MTSKPSEQQPRVALHTLGCKLNYAETSTIAAQFAHRGYQVVPFGQDSDVAVINTCSVTENAEKECRQLIRRTLRKSPNTFVAITGCYAQLRPEELARIEGVDAIFGAEEKFSIFDKILTFEKQERASIFVGDSEDAINYHSAATLSGDSRTRTFLKVQDGCDYSCSYCTIPQARGRSRSPQIDAVIGQAVELCNSGFHEIVLSGVNIGDFGAGTNSDLFALLSAIEAEPAITARLRISSIEPNLLTEAIIDLITNSAKFCPHFHIPMQSGSPEILRLMQRRYNRELYASRIRAINARIPNASIGADVIVGFPGETNRHFEETLEFIESLDLAYLHVFTYSERPGTKAVSLEGSVPVHIRKQRNRILHELSLSVEQRFRNAALHTEATVILEKPSLTANYREGYTESYIKIRLYEQVPLETELVRVRLISEEESFVRAEVIEILASRREQRLLPENLSLPVL